MSAPNPIRAFVPASLEHLVRAKPRPGGYICAARCPDCQCHLDGYAPREGPIQVHVECRACGWWRSVPRHEFSDLFRTHVSGSEFLLPSFDAAPAGKPEEGYQCNGSP